MDFQFYLGYQPRFLITWQFRVTAFILNAI
jgi:hypothetical protein